MDPNFKILPDAVWIDNVSTKPAILAALAQRMGRVYGLDTAMVLEALEEREALGSTGFGRGFAIPHARISGLNRPVAALIRLEEPVDFAAADGLPITLAFGLLSPENAGATHLHALAAISRMMRDEEAYRALTALSDEEALFALLTNVSDRDVA